MKILKKSLPKGHLRSQIDDSVKVESDNRTVELTWSTGFKGMRSGWGESYYEELSMAPEHVDLSRLQNSAPLLASHDAHDLNAVIGVVERAWIENGVGKAIVRFSSEAEADKIYQKVKERILRNVSVGYAVKKYEDVTEKGEQVRTYRATNWQPHEISIVPIGFDPHAQVRGNEVQTEVEINQVEEEIIEPAPEAQPLTEDTRSMTEEEKKALALAAQRAEKTRQAEIRTAVRNAKLEEKFAEELIERDVNIDEARKLVLEKMSESQPAVTSSSVRVEGSDDNQTKRREAFEASLLHKIDRKNFELTTDAREFHGKSLLRATELIIPRYAMESDAAYAKRAMLSADLPLALANVAEKGLQKQYELQPKTYTQWTRQDTLNNYKEFSQVKTGDYGSLVERAENADAAEVEFGEANEVAQLKDFANIHSFSSQMLVNDDLGVIARLSSSSGIAVARLENKEAYLALTTNKVMKDGVALYHATHNNLGTAGIIEKASVAEAYKMMRKQKSTDGLDPLNLTPMIFVCGPDQEVAAREFFASIIPNQSSNVNIFQGSMKIVVDANLTGNQYYFLADPSVIDTVVCYRLAGQEQPTITSRIKFENSSLQLKVEHAFAASMMDWRGVVKNAGQT